MADLTEAQEEVIDTKLGEMNLAEMHTRYEELDNKTFLTDEEQYEFDELDERIDLLEDGEAEDVDEEESDKDV